MVLSQSLLPCSVETHCHSFQQYSLILLQFCARRADNESLKAFESRFEGALLRFRGHRNDINVAESFLALMLFKGSRVEAKQRVGILSASVA